MKAVTFQGVKDIQVKKVEAPKIEKPDDIIIKVTSTAICGSDLHIYLGALPTHKDYVIGHEPMGIVVEDGSECDESEKRRPCRYSIQYFMRSMFLLRA